MVGVHAFQGTRWTVAGEVPGLAGDHPRRSRRTACSRPRPLPCRSPAGRRVCGEHCAGAELDPAEEGSPNPLRVANRDELVVRIETLFASSPPSTGCRRCRSGVPSGKVRSMDDVYAGTSALAGLLLSVDHAPRAARAARVAGPLRRQPVLRRPLRRTGSPDLRPARRVDPGVAGLVSRDETGTSRTPIRRPARRCRKGSRPCAAFLGPGSRPAAVIDGARVPVRMTCGPQPRSTIAATGPPPSGPWWAAETETKTAGSPVTAAVTPPTAALIWRCQCTSESSSIALRRPRT